MTQSENPMQLRLMLAFIGGAGGYVFWVLFEYLPQLLDDQRVMMLIATFLGSLFGGLLLMVGRIGLPVALRYAGGIALVAGLMLFWASYRFSALEDFFETAHPVVAFSVLAWIPIPFALAHETAPQGWRDYEALFDQAWSIFVRTITVWLFTGLFWLVIFLSDQLLSLVGFTYLGDLIENLWFSMPLTGGIVGVAMAVLHELKAVVSTLSRLALQLLRLLLPLVALVVALFVVLVPFEGLDEVFGSFSAAATMLAMALGSVTLITSAVDARDEDTARSRLMVIAARGLAVLLPLIAGIAVYAIWIRVGQYGWTPPRLLGALVSLIALGYALAYGASVLRGRHWRARVRRVNIWMAIVVVGLAFVWLSPVLNAERISARSHVDRFLAGKIGVEDLDVWQLGQDWGKAGKAALGRVRAISGHPDQAEIDNRLAKFDQGESRWAYEQDQSAVGNARDLASLKAILPVRPVGELIPDGLLEKIPTVTRRRVLASCTKPIADDQAGCVLVFGRFDPLGDGLAATIFWRDSAGTGTEIVTVERRSKDGPYAYHRSIIGLGGDPEDRPPEQIIETILNGKYAFVPARLNALEIDGIQILPRR